MEREESREGKNKAGMVSQTAKKVTRVPPRVVQRSGPNTPQDIARGDEESSVEVMCTSVEDWVDT